MHVALYALRILTVRRIDQNLRVRRRAVRRRSAQRTPTSGRATAQRNEPRSRAGPCRLERCSLGVRCPARRTSFHSRSGKEPRRQRLRDIYASIRALSCSAPNSAGSRSRPIVRMTLIGSSRSAATNVSSRPGVRFTDVPAVAYTVGRGGRLPGRVALRGGPRKSGGGSPYIFRHVARCPPPSAPDLASGPATRPATPAPSGRPRCPAPTNLRRAPESFRRL
jgi:hypothetical protein